MGIDGTSDSAREYDRRVGGRIRAQNPKYFRFPDLGGSSTKYSVSSENNQSLLGLEFDAHGIDRSEIEIPLNSTVELSTKNPIAHQFLHSEIDAILPWKKIDSVRTRFYGAHQILTKCQEHF